MDLSQSFAVMSRDEVLRRANKTIQEIVDYRQRRWEKAIDERLQTYFEYELRREIRHNGSRLMRLLRIPFKPRPVVTREQVEAELNEPLGDFIRLSEKDMIFNVSKKKMDACEKLLALAKAAETDQVYVSAEDLKHLSD